MTDKEIAIARIVEEKEEESDKKDIIVGKIEEMVLR